VTAAAAIATNRARNAAATAIATARQETIAAAEATADVAVNNNFLIQ